tara:strand:+ start:52 stop:594 length:543 start_codon:yes stop_codon:yes gene_type:complete
MLLLTPTIYGQSIFDSYANNDDVTLVSISPKMFKMLGKISISVDDLEAREFIEMVNSINNFKVLVSSDKDIGIDMLNWVNQEVNNRGLEELMTVKDKDIDVSFYVKNGKNVDHVKQLLMYVNGEKLETKSTRLNIKGITVESILLLIEGDINLNQISKLTEKMNLPGGNQLKNVKKKKNL